MPYDANPEMGHPEAAGWVLGALDPEETKRFEQHLRSCGECQTVVAEFEPVALALQRAAPAVEPPPDLQARTLASVQRAAAAAKGPARTPARTVMWQRWHWNTRLALTALAATAAAIVAAAVISLQVFQAAAPAEAVTIPLRAPSGGPASGQAVARPGTGGSWTITLSVHGLKNLGPNQFYECWWVASANHPGHPQPIAAGTFTGSGTFTMTSAASPYTFPTMQITAERPGDAGRRGQVILTGTAQT